MWMPIALSRDVPAAVTRAALVEGRELVIWRAEGGAVQVWEDRCPHRGMRLSFGFVRGDTLNCLYHGWQYGTGASCRRIPAHPDLSVPATIKANAYASAETGGFILVRLGDGQLTPPMLPAGRPIASLAVAATPETIGGLVTGTPLELVQGVSTSFDGVTVNLCWHVPGPNRLMLHAVAVDPGGDAMRVLRALYGLRADAEHRAAA
jgi:nitrite reductase/ring-hydroxylating ferredoxin subunit